MSGVGDFIAIATLAVQVGNLCKEYVKSVRHATSEIKDYIARLDRLVIVCESLQKLIERDPDTLPTLQRLLPSLVSCRKGLVEVDKKLRDSIPTGLSSLQSSSFRGLKWPFSRSAMSKEINHLDTNLKDLELPLQVDQLSILLKTHVSIDDGAANTIRVESELDQFRQRELLKLLDHSASAAFNAKERIHRSYCLPGTRVKLLEEIHNWSEDFASKPIFWLCGMAGTGKSTISQELARSFYEDHRLAGSFFFQRGDPNLNRVDNIFTTLAFQTAQPQFPHLRELICDNIERNETIRERIMTDQYDVLFTDPLRKLGQCWPVSKPLVFIIDALDECEDHRGLALLLQKLQSTHDLAALKIKIFLTSRPEQVINTGMLSIADSELHKFQLHDIEQDRVTTDIFNYLSAEFVNIRRKHNLDEGWPSHQLIKNLATKADGLFIYAATISRFLYNCPRRKTVKDLVFKFADKSIIDAASTRYLDAIYVLVLEQCSGTQAPFSSRNGITDLKTILTCMVTSFVPTTPESLSKLMFGIEEDPEDAVYETLDQLTSIVHFNKGQNLRLLHESFRDCLIDKSRCSDLRFYIDMPTAHNTMTDACAHVIKKLGRDICQVREVATHVRDVHEHSLDRFLPEYMSYACRYWLQHALCCDLTNSIIKTIQKTLLDQALSWLEALAWLEDLPIAVQCLRDLASRLAEYCSENTADQFAAGLHVWVADLIKFVTTYDTSISTYPLQIYCSALYFAPSKSIVARYFHDQKSRYLMSSLMEDFKELNWDNSLCTFIRPHSMFELILHDESDIAVIASPSIKVISLVSGKTLREISTNEIGTRRNFNKVCLSSNGSMVAIGVSGGPIVVFNTITGDIIFETPRNSHQVAWMQFVISDKYIVVGYYSGKVIRVTIQGSGFIIDVIQDNIGSFIDGPEDVALSGRLMAVRSSRELVTIWDIEELSIVDTINLQDWRSPVLRFSNDGEKLLLGERCLNLRLWSKCDRQIHNLLPDYSQLDPRQRLNLIATGDEWCRSIQISSSGSWFCYMNKEGQLAVANLVDPLVEKMIIKGSISSAQFVPEEEVLVVSFNQKDCLGVLYCAKGTIDLIPQYPFSGDVYYSENARLIARIWQSADIVRVWETASLLSGATDTSDAVGTSMHTLTPQAVLITTEKGFRLRIRPLSQRLDRFIDPGVIDMGGKILKLYPSITGNLVSVVYRDANFNLVMVDVNSRKILTSLAQASPDEYFCHSTGVFSSGDHFLYWWQGRMIVWNSINLSMKALVVTGSSWSTPIAISSDGRLVAFWINANLRIWDLASGVEKSIYMAEPAQQGLSYLGARLRFSPNDEYIVLSGPSVACTMVSLKTNISEAVAYRAGPNTNLTTFADAWFDSRSENLWLQASASRRLIFWDCTRKQSSFVYRESDGKEQVISFYDSYDLQTDSFNFTANEVSHGLYHEIDARSRQRKIGEDETFEHMNQAPITISPARDWVLVGGRRCIHLPHNRRPTLVTKDFVSQTGSLVVLRNEDGVLTVLNLDTKDQPWLLEPV